jgi:phenylacetate-CoA ligase
MHAPTTTVPQATARTAGAERSGTRRRRAGLPLALRVLLALALPPVELLVELAGRRYRPFLALVRTTPPWLLAALGRWRALRTFEHTRRRVPAYAAFLAERAGAGAGPLRRASLDPLRLRLPETDKDGYVRRWTIPERCVGGELPLRGVAIDESSGSTGTPHNWVRGQDERAVTHTFISHFARYCYGDEPWITINAFSMGAWATGVNLGIAMQRESLVKCTGPDVDKILSTMQVFGTGRRYLVCGYPPFLKRLVDAAAERGFPLAGYRLAGLVGGEGMSEGLRDYLCRTFELVYSGYGATDLEIGMAGETPLSVALRRAARDHPGLRRALFGDDQRLPMVFQYNPLSHHVTVNQAGELVVTITRRNLLSPRIAYNVGDEGGVATYQEVAERARAAGVDLAGLAVAGGPAPLRLPFLWVHGRKDSTVSVMGANLYPEDVERALYDEPELAAVTNSFCLGLVEDADANPRPCFAFELRRPVTPALRRAFEQRVVARVEAMNADFREAMREHPASARPLVELHPLGAGPFAADAGRIKQTRLLRTGC